MNDRITKTLLTVIAVALWGLLLRPALTPIPSHAAPTEIAGISPAYSPRFQAPVVKISPTGGHLYVIDNAGNVYSLNAQTLDVERSVRLRAPS